MEHGNLVLVVGAYSAAEAAGADYKALKAGEDAGEYQVVGAVVMHRDAEGKVDVDEHDSGAHVGGGAVLGGTAEVGGRIVRAAAPGGDRRSEPESARSLEALARNIQEKHLGVEMEEYLPPGSLAVVAIVDDVWADRVEAALVKADKRINKAIDKGDYDELQKAIDQSSGEISDAITS